MFDAGLPKTSMRAYATLLRMADTDNDPNTDLPPIDEWADELLPDDEAPQEQPAERIVEKWRALHANIRSGMPLADALISVGSDIDYEPTRPSPYHDYNLTGNRAFKKGNPGRIPGTRSKKMMLAERLLDGGAKDVVKKVIAMALEGDPIAMKLVMDRILPVRRGRPLHLGPFPEIRRPKDVVEALNFVAARSTDGTISFEEAEAASSLIEATRRAIETIQLEERIKALEEARTIDGSVNDLRRGLQPDMPLHRSYAMGWMMTPAEDQIEALEATVKDLLARVEKLEAVTLGVLGPMVIHVTGGRPQLISINDGEYY